MDTKRRVDAVFTSGEVYSGQDGWGTVLDKDGDEKFRFPLGDMYLAYECYLKGEPTLVFVLPILLVPEEFPKWPEYEFRVYTRIRGNQRGTRAQ